jgi:diguanylate cyclase (GGDEF)-like protein
VTVLRPDIAEPEPIQDGAGWVTFDAPTRPAGPHPLPRDGRLDLPYPAPSDADHRTNGGVDSPVTNTVENRVPQSADTTARHTTEPAPAFPIDAELGTGGDVPTGGQADSSKLIRLHESIAALLASRGEWEQAYQHLRSALDLVYSDRIDELPVPEQLRREVDQLRKEHAEAREQSIRDSLTASYNRRYLDQRLTSLLADTAQAGDGTGLAVALADLDWFKQVNDTFGHLVGDRVLQRVVDLLSDGLPDGAFCARYGGEEFVLVVPGIDAPAAVAVAEAARARVECNPWSQLVPGLRVTVSIGLAHEPAGGNAAGRPPTSAEQQLLRADGLLYAAKQSGRNAVAYRRSGRVWLAGAAANGRRIAESRVAVTPQR